MVTITQQPNNKSVYFYPDTDLSGCTEWTAIGNVMNYECVDDERGKTDFLDYVEINATTFQVDLYELPNSTQSGTINYVRTHIAVKADSVPSSDIEMYLTCSPDSTCTHIYYSDEKPLTNAWSKKSYTWSENPADSLAWEWADIDTLAIGIRGKSSIPGTEHTETQTLRPNGAGDATEWTPVGDAPNYKCVDEVTKDDDTTYNYVAAGINKYDHYQIEDTTNLVGKTINSVTVYSWTRVTSGSINGRLGLRFGGSLYWSTMFSAGTSWQFSQYTWTSNPNTGNPFTSAEIDGMQIGIESSAGLRCTQLYAVVEYIDTDAIDLKVAQCYAEINYTPPETTIDLNPVIATSRNHASNVKTINFWNGDREVYALNRSGKSLMLSGAFYDKYDGADSPFTRIDELREMGKDGSDIVLEGFTLDCFNGTYKINSLGWRLRSTNLEVYEWVLQLESTEL